MHRKILMSGLLIALLSVVLGAFGAHALKNLLSADKLAIFETGVRYQFLHAFALIALAIYTQVNPGSNGKPSGLKWAANFFVTGVLFFSGSLYLLSFQPLCSFNYSQFIGPITPMGGLLFILGWASWLRNIWLNKVDK